MTREKGNPMGSASLLLEPADDGVIEELNKKLIREGEEGLLVAVLQQATEDFQKYVLATGKEGKKLFKEAEDWILDTESDAVFSFEYICECLQINPCYLRRGFMRWKQEKLDEYAKKSAESETQRVA